MMYKLNNWSDIPGKEIEEIDWREGDATVQFQFDEGILEVESSELGMPVKLYVCNTSEQAAEAFDVQSLVSLVVRRLDVPFVAKDFNDPAVLTLGFDEGPDVCLASADPSVPLRIS